MNNNIDWKKYLIVFLITIGLFLTASYISNYFGSKKIDQIKLIQDKIAIDILSSETQFFLFLEIFCEKIFLPLFPRASETSGKKKGRGEKKFSSHPRLARLRIR